MKRRNDNMYVFTPDDLESDEPVFTPMDSADFIPTPMENLGESNVINDQVEQKTDTINDSMANHVPTPVYNQDDKYLLYKKLPFARRKMDFFTWLERNSIPVLITVVFFVISIFILASVRIDLMTSQLIEGVMIQMQPEPEPPKIEEIPEKKQEVLEIEKMMSVKNQVADANAKLDAGLKDDRSTKTSEILRQAQEVQDKLDANKAAYEKGLNEANMIAANAAATAQSSKKSDKGEGQKQERIPTVSKRGNVTVEYDLPGRYATVLPIPAYKCQEGGKVIVDIVVDKNGDVLSVAINASSSGSSVCIAEMALEAAKNSRFDVKSTAQLKEKGTITYIFLAQ